MDVVTLDAAAAENGLGMMLQGLLAENLAVHDGKRRAFLAMSSTFGVVAPDADVTVTLAFGDGRCTIYDGLGHAPDAVITTDSGRIPELTQLSTRFGVPWLLDAHGQSFVRALVYRDIRVAGLVRLSPLHAWRSIKAALDLVRLTRILSVND